VSINDVVIRKPQDQCRRGYGCEELILDQSMVDALKAGYILDVPVNEGEYYIQIAMRKDSKEEESA